MTIQELVDSWDGSERVEALAWLMSGVMDDLPKGDKSRPTRTWLLREMARRFDNHHVSEGLISRHAGIVAVVLTHCTPEQADQIYALFQQAI